METQSNNILYKLTRLFLVTLSLAHFSGFNSIYAVDNDWATSFFTNDPGDDSVEDDKLQAEVEKTAETQGKISYRFDGEERLKDIYSMIKVYRDLVDRESPENVPPRFQLIELTLQRVTQSPENLYLLLEAGQSGKSEITFVNLILKTFFTTLEGYMKELKEATSDILNESQKRLRAKLEGYKLLSYDFKKEIMKEARELREGDIQQVEQLYKNFFVAYTETLYASVIEKYLSPDLMTDDLKAELETLSDLKKRIMMLPGIKDNINKQE